MQRWLCSTAAAAVADSLTKITTAVSDWSRDVTWHKYWPLIGGEQTRKQETHNSSQCLRSVKQFMWSVSYIILATQQTSLKVSNISCYYILVLSLCSWPLIDRMSEYWPLIGRSVTRSECPGFLRKCPQMKVIGSITWHVRRVYSNTLYMRSVYSNTLYIYI